ncbi:uncharacterized protein LOC108929669 [Scleropages formosus]|uniref:Uncharacterized LOC108929669 n=1 Tax=Scleropages formosus TaxID=113540 RepID=A0A8C9SA33_SCLFO|nr:uncharacterized protein LOC108929669 [Scleropages formosus]
MRLSFLLIFSCTTVANDILQPELITAELGHSVTLTCFSRKDEVTYTAWFKQQAVQKPRIMAKAFSYSQTLKVQGEFKNMTRFSFQWRAASFNLTIANIEPSDSAVYYCATMSFNEISFGDGTVLILTDYNRRTVVQQPVSDPVRPGDSVTLQCTVDSETCAGEHSVYWFRHGSGESLPGLIYTHGKRSDECEKSPEAGSPTHSCVYSLPKRNLSRSDAGIYYCAVATCGNILFGNGTKLNIDTGHWNLPPSVVLSLVITLAVSIFANAVFVCTRNNNICGQHAGKSVQESQCEILMREQSSKQCQDVDVVNYVALNLKNSKAKRKKRETTKDTVYSDLKGPDWE